MSNQVKLQAELREERGKGAAGRLRRQGRVPGIMYGYQVEPTAVSVDQLELYHVLHTDAGSNALIQLRIGDEVHLTVARDMQRHPVRQETTHVDFLAVDKDSQISVEVPVHVIDEDDAVEDNGIINTILYTVPILVKPLDVPNYVEVSVAGMAIGDVKRVEDLIDQLPDGAEFDIDHERTVVTINAPVSEEELEALEDAAGVEQEPTDEAIAEESEAESADDTDADADADEA